MKREGIKNENNILITNISTSNMSNINTLATEANVDSSIAKKLNKDLTNAKDKSNKNNVRLNSSREDEENTNLLTVDNKHFHQNTFFDMSNHTCQEKEQIPEIDRILNQAGYNFYTLKMIFFTWTILLIDGFHLNFNSSMIIPLTGYYGFSKINNMILPGIIFIGNTLGSLSISFLSKFFQRTTLIIYSVLFSSFFYAAMIFIKSPVIFGISRFFIGFSIAISTTCSLGILTEYLPIKYRGFVLSSIWTGYTCGQFALLIIMLFSMPNLEVENTYITMIISLIIPLIAIFSSFFIAQDGPRNLILKSREKEAFEILEKINKSSFSEEKKIRIINSIKTGGNQNFKGKFCDIFEKTFARTTMLLTFIRTNHALISFGILAINTLTLDHLSHSHYNSSSENGEFGDDIKDLNKNYKILVDEILIVFTIVMSDILAGIQSEIRFLGRKLSLVLNYFIGFIFMVCCYLASQYFSLFLGFSLCFISVASIINHTYCLEIYSTKVRDNAMGFLFACRRIGGFVAQVLFVYLDSIHMWSPYYICSGILFINVILCSFLEKETYNKSIE